MAKRRGINALSSSKKKIRIDVRHILIAVFALTLAIIFSTTRLVQQNGVNKTRYNPLLIGNPQEINANAIQDEAGEPSVNYFHFIVSSDCTSYQRWETLTQLHSAQSVSQCGRFTWIVSGCLEEGSGHIGKGKGGANSDILTHASLLEEVERHFPTLTISNHTIANGMGRSADVARSHDDCSTIHPHVHFTPNYADMSIYGGPFADGKKKRTFLNRKGNVMHGNFGNTYKFNNKPNGLHHWAENFFEQDDRRDEAIVLIDPDFLFLNKFELPDNTPPVLPGNPAAAKYGLGAQVRLCFWCAMFLLIVIIGVYALIALFFLIDLPPITAPTYKFLDFNLTQICDRAPALPTVKGPLESNVCPFASVSSKDVNHYYSAGPPYIIHIMDVRALSHRWSELVPPTYDYYPLLYAEMFAYSMAAADLDLKHNLIKGLFAGCMTGWPHTNGKGELEALELSAKTYANSIGYAPGGNAESNQGAFSCFLPPISPPPFLHYCSRYSFVTPYLGGKNIESSSAPTYHFFAKRRVDHDILDCSHNDHPLEPFISTKPEKLEGGNKDWNVLAVCAVVRAINFAKKTGCETIVK